VPGTSPQGSGLRRSLSVWHVGATLGPRAGVVAGWGLLGTYTFYGVVTSTAAGIFGAAFLKAVGAWPSPPSWAPFLLAGVALALTLVVAVFPARRGANVLLSVEGATVALILIVTAIVFARRLGVALTESEGIAAGGPATRAEELPASDAAGGYTSSA
jgi:amino acid transporter